MLLYMLCGCRLEAVSAVWTNVDRAPLQLNALEMRRADPSVTVARTASTAHHAIRRAAHSAPQSTRTLRRRALPMRPAPRSLPRRASGMAGRACRASRAVCCALHVARRVLRVVCCTLHVARRMLHVARCALRVVCCMLRVECCVSRGKMGRAPLGAVACKMPTHRAGCRRLTTNSADALAILGAHYRRAFFRQVYSVCAFYIYTCLNICICIYTHI